MVVEEVGGVERVDVGGRVLVVDPFVGGMVLVVGVGVVIMIVEELVDNEEVLVAVEVAVEIAVEVGVVKVVDSDVVVVEVGGEVVVVETVVGILTGMKQSPPSTVTPPPKETIPVSLTTVPFTQQLAPISILPPA